jgi:hypothetical protein
VPEADEHNAPMAGGAAWAGSRVPARPSLTGVTCSAEAGSASEEALCELARWTETHAKLPPVAAESST